MDDFGQLVKHKRRLKGLSTRELSKLVGMSSAYVSQLERGLVKRPEYSVAKRLAEVLDVHDSVLDFYGFVPEEVEQHFIERGQYETENRRLMEEAYISNLSEKIEAMDLESLEAVSYAINQHMDITWKLYLISCAGDRQAVATVKELIDFLYNKYVVAE